MPPRLPGGQADLPRATGPTYALADKNDGSSQVAGKFAVAPLPGLNGPGVSSLGGHALGISTFAKNKKTAVDFIKFYTSKEPTATQVEQASLAPGLDVDLRRRVAAEATSPT